MFFFFRSTVSKIIADYGRIDYLVNNGGGQFPSMTHDMSLKGWNAVIETNLTGTFLMSKEVFNQFFHEHGGVITNIIAVMERGFPMMGHTGAARAAVENMTKCLRDRYVRLFCEDCARHANRRAQPAASYFSRYCN